MIDYKKRFVEVDEIIKNMPKEDFNKIPNDLYVIGNIAIEGILLLQSSSGEIMSFLKMQKYKKSITVFVII